MAAAAKGNNNKEVLRERNCPNEDFYYLPRKFKNLAKPPLAACTTCRPGFYTALTVWSFILPAERLSSTNQLSSFLFLQFFFLLSLFSPSTLISPFLYCLSSHYFVFAYLRLEKSIFSFPLPFL